MTNYLVSSQHFSKSKRTYAVANSIRFLYINLSPYHVKSESSECITRQIPHFPNLQCLSIGLQKDRLQFVRIAGSAPFPGRKGDQREDGNHLLTMTVCGVILHRAIRIAAEKHLTKIAEHPPDHPAEAEHRIRIMIPGAKVPYRKVSVMLHVEREMRVRVQSVLIVCRT
jgi:hypothetical protein